MTLRALAAFPLLAALTVPTPTTQAPDASLQQTVPDASLRQAVPDASLRQAVPDASLRQAVLDLRPVVESLETETARGPETEIAISSDVLFAFDRATLTPAAVRHLTGIDARLRTVTGTVRVDGHTDAKGATGYNLTLSRRRAASVKRELDRVLNGTPQVVAAGHGESDPVAPDVKDGKDNPSGRAKNRRVVIRFTG